METRMRIPLDLPPGLNGDDTSFAGNGRWADGSNVRFRLGRAQVIGGWEGLLQSPLTGVCRTVFPWTDNAAVLNIAFGTHSKLQLWQGGALFDIGCYCVNFSRAVTGTEPIRVTANAHFDETSGIDLTLTGTLEFPEHVTAQFGCSFEAEPSFGAEVIGTDGRILIPHPWMPPVWPTEFTIARATKSEIVRVEPPGAPAHLFANFALELAHFAACARGETSPLVTAADSLGNARTIDALLSAARSGQ